MRCQYIETDRNVWKQKHMDRWRRERLFKLIILARTSDAFWCPCTYILASTSTHLRRLFDAARCSLMLFVSEPVTGFLGLRLCSPEHASTTQVLSQPKATSNNQNPHSLTDNFLMHWTCQSHVGNVKGIQSHHIYPAASWKMLEMSVSKSHCSWWFCVTFFAVSWSLRGCWSGSCQKKKDRNCLSLLELSSQMYSKSLQSLWDLSPSTPETQETNVQSLLWTSLGFP